MRTMYSVLCLCAHVCEGEQVRISLCMRPCFLFNEIPSKRWRCPKCASLWMWPTGFMPRRSHTSSPSWRSNPIIRMRTSSTRVFYVSQLQLHRKTATPHKNLCTVCERTPNHTRISYYRTILQRLHKPAFAPLNWICWNCYPFFSFFRSLFIFVHVAHLLF